MNSLPPVFQFKDEYCLICIGDIIKDPLLLVIAEIKLLYCDCCSILVHFDALCKHRKAVCRPTEVKRCSLFLCIYLTCLWSNHLFVSYTHCFGCWLYLVCYLCRPLKAAIITVELRDALFLSREIITTMFCVSHSFSSCVGWGRYVTQQWHNSLLTVFFPPGGTIQHLSSG